MKILVVTDQTLLMEGEKILGSTNFTNIIKRLCVIGELHLCLQKPKENGNCIQVFNDCLNDYIIYDNICYINKSFVWPSSNVISTLKEAISKVDLVIGYVPSLNAEFAAHLAHKARKKYFALMVACPWDGLWNQDWKRKIAAPYRYLMNRRVLSRSDYALYVTNKFLQKRYPTNGISIGLSDVVLEKCDDNVLEQRKRKINILSDNGIIRIATVAMLNIRYKGQRFVIRALRKLKDMGYNNYHYFLIGGGDDSALRKEAEKLGVIDQIHFVGKMSHEEVFNILDDVDIYVHPSLQEGLPRSVVEAMSRALPCIGARTGAIPELLNNDFIVSRKSVDDIVDRLLTMRDKKIMLKEAERNFEEAKKFECELLDKRRNIFYDKIRQDFN